MLQIYIEQRKKDRDFINVYYSPSICSRNENRYGWFSRNVRNGELIGLVFDIPTSSVAQSLSLPYISAAFAFII